MRKTLIALMLVLPMAFVLVIFTSVNAVSLGVPISANGIAIHAEGADENGTLFIDMADKTEHTVTAEVTPGNATEKGYTLSSSDPDLVDVTGDGRIIPKREGTVSITATSNDKSFTDSMSVVVVSSKPYDFDFSIQDKDGQNILKETENGYEGTLPAGRYSYQMAVEPVEFTQYSIVREGELHAEADRGAKEIFLPFSGDAEFSVTVPGGVSGDIRKQVLLHVQNPSNDVLINGEKDFDGVEIAAGTTQTQLFVECRGGRPSFSSEHASCNVTGTNDRYILDITIDDGAEESFLAKITAGGKTCSFWFSVTDFAFTVTSDMEINEGKVTLLTGNDATFYAVASSGAKGVEYEWEFSGPAEYIAVDGDTATVNALRGGQYTLSVTATYGTHVATQEIELSIINKISVVQIAGDVSSGLAANYTVAGLTYGEGLVKTDNTFPLTVYTYSTSGVSKASNDDVEYTVSDDGIAEIDTQSGSPVLIPRGTGKVTITAAWKGNEAFKTNIRGELTLNIVKEGVAVKNAPELIKAMEEGVAAVLVKDIKLGVNADGSVMSLDEREAYLKAHRMKSTYNTEWYKHAAGMSEQNAYISYVLEFTNSVYGNGKEIDADYFTHAHDSSGKPLLNSYKNPLYFVKYQEVASVAGQDNCAFLIRKDGIKLYGVNLLGCSDDSLMNASGTYDLTQLNLTGTTLEVNADCEIINCRIRNGRNVLRIYGGNRNGDKYFIDSLSENTNGVDGERINVTIDGCILSQGREFILKTGANRALRATSATMGAEPALLNQNGRAYSESGASNRYDDGKLYEDDWFYSHYVLTDVTLKDSVLETSGLFTVGIESNFAGKMLAPGYSGDFSAATKDWQYSGGTSFAAVLRLEGDVRLYDWKDLSLVDSSTLIESPLGTGALSGWLKLDINAMLDFVSKNKPDLYGEFIETTSDGKQYVHGGIALYGGGRNYSAVDLSGLNEGLADLNYMNINISVLKDGGGLMEQQGTKLPLAAGTHDFNFYMYGKESANNYAAQRAAEQNGTKYKGVAPVPLF